MRHLTLETYRGPLSSTCIAYTTKRTSQKLLCNVTATKRCKVGKYRRNFKKYTILVISTQKQFG